MFSVSVHKDKKPVDQEWLPRGLRHRNGNSEIYKRKGRAVVQAGLGGKGEADFIFVA